MADTLATERSGRAAVDPRAKAFVNARLAGHALAAYPGALPSSLAEAYEVQSEAIGLWPDKVAGWKVGRINAPWDATFGTDRLAGPIFARQIQRRSVAPAPAFLFAGGFGAIEGEIVIEVGEDAPVDKCDWSLAEAAAIAGAARLGIEIASSPFAGINDLGPLVTVSDFGNNHGLIIGDEIAEWRGADPTSWRLRTFIDGVLIGAADASSIPGGPLESFRALLEITARRGLPVKAGALISTGAVTGVHVIRAGQSATIEMDGIASIDCRAATAPSAQVEV